MKIFDQTREKHADNNHLSSLFAHEIYTEPKNSISCLKETIERFHVF